MIDEIKLKALVAMVDVEEIIDLCEKHQLTNEQWFLDFLDQLNKLSVKF
ncbi:MAG: hypothetical protein Q4C49_00135 [Bacillota bacterium]|nr:hypothetical protein [Bacillota bacterium]